VTKTEPLGVIANVRVGTPDIAPSAPSHIPGVHEGNHPRRIGRPPIRTARRSTGIRWRQHSVIDPRMPVITPA
jgi:hypothetical protein